MFFTSDARIDVNAKLIAKSPKIFRVFTIMPNLTVDEITVKPVNNDHL